ncbi:von Willebrand factor type A domain-containing protein [Lutibacter sp. TH_r2]|uniref:vWA domain-containing protein n=1 Tax=Lutibacter sp. TH_r2 TaxID=3082083 RepID=UPI00295390FD|nr:von Willebrand factor type A domain-containing protein [Lutibacter sp. TH_r2]MDV7187156.1 von Willebrand factor type A domain-containing protein [Lutibacter sp. TH_r2]
MKIYFYFLVSLFLAIQLNAQEKIITGIITDESGPLPGVNILIKGTTTGTTSNFDGEYAIEASVGDMLVFNFVGMKTSEVTVGSENIINVLMEADSNCLEEVVVVVGYGRSLKGKISGLFIRRNRKSKPVINYSNPVSANESYKEINENTFKSSQLNPLSTFSIDVDKAAYSNVRRMINNGQKIPKEAVKIEEFINYFKYNYSQPTSEQPFSINTEVAETPWNKDTKIVKIGLQGKDLDKENIPKSNLVFLLDVSGSMGDSNKLPLLKSAFKLLVNQLREEDKVSIVVYAGAAGVVLKPTSGDNKEKILNALNKLESGGSTAGGKGIELAYKLAEKHFVEGGNNRVIMATDGDFNVGASSDKAMKDLIVEKRKSGVFLTVLGFGYGNLKDSKLETLADKGNGNYAYIDTMQEANKTFGEEFAGTMYTIAKDVKIQVEFNPNKVQAYRLIGYENRLLNAEDFKDDKKDAGELGSGHTVTALYEIIPVGVKSKFLKNIDNLKYTKANSSNKSDELLTVKFRYKKPNGDKSIEIVEVVKDEKLTLDNMSSDFKFSSAVALFGMNLTKSKFTNKAKLDKVIELAKAGKGEDENGYRSEFIRLVKSI